MVWALNAIGGLGTRDIDGVWFGLRSLSSRWSEHSRLLRRRTAYLPKGAPPPPPPTSIPYNCQHPSHGLIHRPRPSASSSPPLAQREGESPDFISPPPSSSVPISNDSLASMQCIFAGAFLVCSQFTAPALHIPFFSPVFLDGTRYFVTRSYTLDLAIIRVDYFFFLSLSNTRIAYHCIKTKRKLV